MSLVSKMIEKVFLSPTSKVEGDLPSYIKALESGRFNDRVVYGVSDNEKGFLVIDPVKNPGALYCGGMGSGKSVAMRFTVATHIFANSENTFYILVDTLKGMTDYTQLFADDVDDFGNVLKPNPYKKNVVAAVNDAAKIVPVIDMVYEECMSRKEEFSRVGANNIYTYEKIMKDKDADFNGLARVMICIEEFHAIPNSPQVRFGMKVDQTGSLAAKFKELMRVGRSYGICFMFATQRATSEDVPSQLKPGLSIMMAFRMNNPGEASAMNLPHAQDIGSKQNGRCAYEAGFIQYPYIDDKVLDAMLKKYYKPLKAALLKAQPEDYHQALTGEGNDGMVQIKPFKDIIKFANQYNFKTIAKRVLNEFKIELEDQENEAFVADMIGRKYDDVYAIKLINNREQGSKKEMEALVKGAESLGCNKILVMISEVSAPMGVSGLERGTQVPAVVLDNDDLIQIANMLDSRKELEAQQKFEEFYLRYGISDIRDFRTEVENVQETKETAPVMEKVQDSKASTPGNVEVLSEEEQFEEEENQEVENKLAEEPKPIAKAQEVKEFSADDISESLSNKVQDSIKTKVQESITKLEESNQDLVRAKLREEREKYKEKMKADRKKFLEEIEAPIVKEEPAEENADSAEITEAKEELEREETKESLDKDILLKIRERLKENILKERGV